MNDQNTLNKWYPILEQAQIEEKYYNKVAIHLEYLTELEYHPPTSLSFLESFEERIKTSLVPLELKIIAGIKDLSKVIFVQNEWVYLNTDTSVTDNRIDLDSNLFKATVPATVLLNIPNFEVFDFVEKSFLNLLTYSLNNLIKEGNIIYASNFAASVMMITEKTMEPQIILKSKYKAVKL